MFIVAQVGNGDRELMGLQRFETRELAEEHMKACGCLQATKLELWAPNPMSGLIRGLVRQEGVVSGSG
jgi:hypothetical protein